MSTKEKLLNLIEQRLAVCEARRCFIIAVDGRCGSGKTTLSKWLSERLCCPVVHMDDFFLPPEKRTKERLAKAGENIDHERFLAQVLTPLKRGEAARFCPFDCTTMLFGKEKCVCGRLVIVEGSYSCHPSLWGQYDLRVFCDIDAKLQIKRITERNGEKWAQIFRQRFIPLEEKYFEAFQIQERCDITLFI